MDNSSALRGGGGPVMKLLYYEIIFPRPEPVVHPGLAPNPGHRAFASVAR